MHALSISSEDLKSIFEAVVSMSIIMFVIAIAITVVLKVINGWEGGAHEVTEDDEIERGPLEAIKDRSKQPIDEKPSKDVKPGVRKVLL